MEVVLLPTPEDCGRVVADAVAGSVLAALRRGGPVVLCLATGSSPLLVYRELLRRQRDDGRSFVGVQAFLLD